MKLIKKYLEGLRILLIQKELDNYVKEKNYNKLSYRDGRSYTQNVFYAYDRPYKNIEYYKLAIDKEVDNLFNKGMLRPKELWTEVVVNGTPHMLLYTYPPSISEFIVGHSELSGPDFIHTHLTPSNRSMLYVDRRPDSKNYNLITNNCADATYAALDDIYLELFDKNNKPLGLIMTPNRVRELALEIPGAKEDVYDDVIITHIPLSPIQMVRYKQHARSTSYNDIDINKYYNNW